MIHKSSHRPLQLALLLALCQGTAAAQVPAQPGAALSAGRTQASSAQQPRPAVRRRRVPRALRVLGHLTSAASHRLRGRLNLRRKQRQVRWAQQQLDQQGRALSDPLRYHSRHLQAEQVHLQLAARDLRGVAGTGRLRRWLRRRAKGLAARRPRSYERIVKAADRNGYFSNALASRNADGEQVLYLNADRRTRRADTLYTMAHEGQHLADYPVAAASQKGWTQIYGNDGTNIETRAFRTESQLKGRRGSALGWPWQGKTQTARGYNSAEINRTVIQAYLSGTRDRLKPALLRARPRTRALVNAFLDGYRQGLEAQAQRAYEPPASTATPQAPQGRLQRWLQRAHSKGKRAAGRLRVQSDTLRARATNDAKVAYCAGQAAVGAALPAARGASILLGRPVR